MRAADVGNADGLKELAKNSPFPTELHLKPGAQVCILARLNRNSWPGQGAVTRIYSRNLVYDADLKDCGFDFALL